MRPLDPPNPFLERGAIRDPARFFGRTAEIEQIFARLSNMQSVSLVGERRIGKSSLLYQLAQLSGEYLGPEVRVVHTDLPAVTDETEFFQCLCQELGVPGSAFRDLQRATRDRPVVAYLDEFEKVLDQQGFRLGFFDSLRSLANAGNLALVLATRSSLSDLSRNQQIRTSPFWNIFFRLDLGLLDHDDARQLVTSGFAGAGLDIREEEVVEVIALAGRFPCFLQMACCHLFEMKAGRAGDWRPAFREEVGDHLVYLWEHLAKEERSALRWTLGYGGPLPSDDLLWMLERRGTLVPDPTKPHGRWVFSEAFLRYVVDPPSPPRHLAWWRRLLLQLTRLKMSVGGFGVEVEFRTNLPEPAVPPCHIPNPYVAPRPLTPDRRDVFLGRSEVFRFVEERFLDSNQMVPIVLYGQPRIGKSSILRHFTARLSTDLVPVYVDMQAAAQVYSTGALLFNLGDAMGRVLARWGMAVRAPALDEYAAEPFVVFQKWLDAVEAALDASQSRLVLALDEFEEIETKLTEGSISRDFMPFLRSVMQHSQSVALLFAGTHTLDQMIQEYWLPYFRSAVPYRVSYLDRAAATRLVTNPVEEFTLGYDPEAVEVLLDVTHCHPCLLQFACSALVDLKNHQGSHHASVEDVRQALDVALDIGEYALLGVWDWLPPEERRVLSRLAPDRQSSLEGLSLKTGESAADLKARLESLIAREVVAPVNGDGRGVVYQFQVELFRRWVARRATRLAAGT